MERTKWIHIRVSDEERSAWQALAHGQGLTVADLIRRQVGLAQPGGRQPKRRKRLTQQADPTLLRELARIGNNLNQVARWANTCKTAAEALQVCAQLVAIERYLKALKDPEDKPVGCRTPSTWDSGDAD